MAIIIQEATDRAAVERWVDGEFDTWDAQSWTATRVALTAERDGILIGAAVGKCTAGIGHLDELIVGEGERDHGIGTQLLAAFEEWARQQGAHLCTLHTDAARPAARFYARHGWRTLYAIENHYHHRTTLLMAKELSSPPPA